MREYVYIRAVKSGGEIIASFLKETTSGKKYSNSHRNKLVSETVDLFKIFTY